MLEKPSAQVESLRQMDSLAEGLEATRVEASRLEEGGRAETPLGFFFSLITLQKTGAPNQNHCQKRVDQPIRSLEKKIENTNRQTDII